MSKIILTYSDGGSRGNPGPAAIGVVLKSPDGKIIATHKEKIGITTNNQAEYRALITALHMAKEHGAEEVHANLDSELVVKQCLGEYRVKDKDLQPQFIKVHNASLAFKKVTYKHIRREFNTEADALVNEALDNI